MEDKPVFRIFPTDEGVKIPLSVALVNASDDVFSFYTQLLDAVVPASSDKYDVEIEDDDLLIKPGRNGIEDPMDFARVQVELIQLARRLADLFNDTIAEGGVFKR